MTKKYMRVTIWDCLEIPIGRWTDSFEQEVFEIGREGDIWITNFDTTCHILDSREPKIVLTSLKTRLQGYDIWQESIKFRGRIGALIRGREMYKSENAGLVAEINNLSNKLTAVNKALRAEQDRVRDLRKSLKRFSSRTHNQLLKEVLVKELKRLT